jgi:transposase-like protein
MSSSTVICKKCGAKYERITHKVIFRDNDHFDCQVCNETLEEWSGSRIPQFKLIERPEKVPE